MPNAPQEPLHGAHAPKPSREEAEKERRSHEEREQKKHQDPGRTEKEQTEHAKEQERRQQERARESAQAGPGAPKPGPEFEKPGGGVEDRPEGAYEDHLLASRALQHPTPISKHPLEDEPQTAEGEEYDQEIQRRSLERERSTRNQVSEIGGVPMAPDSLGNPKVIKRIKGEEDAQKKSDERPGFQAAPAVGTAIVGTTTIDTIFNTVYATRANMTGTVAYQWSDYNKVQAWYTDGSIITATFIARPLAPSQITF
jgi:hypothetical protein